MIDRQSKALYIKEETYCKKEHHVSPLSLAPHQQLNRGRTPHAYQPQGWFPYPTPRIPLRSVQSAHYGRIG